MLGGWLGGFQVSTAPGVYAETEFTPFLYCQLWAALLLLKSGFYASERGIWFECCVQGLNHRNLATSNIRTTRFRAVYCVFNGFKLRSYSLVSSTCVTLHNFHFLNIACQIIVYSTGSYPTLKLRGRIMFRRCQMFQSIIGGSPDELSEELVT